MVFKYIICSGALLLLSMMAKPRSRKLRSITLIGSVINFKMSI